MFRILKITGDSMSPEFEDGDFVLIATIPAFFRSLKAGDAVVFRHAGYGTLIKKIERVAEGGDLIVAGTQAESLDSRRLGPISKDRVRGKVIWRIHK
ncbi:MAG: S26 family signal peptidase [Chloroflexota bacterium]